MSIKQLTMDELKDIISKQYPFTNQNFNSWGNIFNFTSQTQQTQQIELPSNPQPEKSFHYTYIETRY